ERDSVKSNPKTAEIDLVLGKEVATKLLGSHEELAIRVAKMRKKFATPAGFVVPENKVTDEISIKDESYQIRIHGTTVAAYDLRVGELMVVLAGARRPAIPG